MFFVLQIVWPVLSLVVGLSEAACVERSCPLKCICQCKQASVTIHCGTLDEVALETFFKLHANATSDLHFTDSHLDFIPGSICFLNKLSNLDLSHNQLRDVTNDDIGCFKKTLVRLHLDHNRIDILRNGLFDGFKKLEQFSADNNSISVIQTLAIDVSSLERLRSIELSYNQLSTFDMAFLGLPALRDHVVRVNMSNNLIKNVTNHLGLRHSDLPANMSINVDLTYNKISTVDTDGLARMLHVSSILKLNKFDKSDIDLRHNPFLCNCKLAGFVSLVAYLRKFIKQSSLFALYCWWKSGPELNGKLLYKVRNEELKCDVTEHCPGSCTCQRTGKDLFGEDLLSVKCNSSYTNKVLPKTLPKASTINLEFYESSLRGVTAFDEDQPTYLRNVSVLKLHVNEINFISLDVLPYFDKMKQIYLHQNNIRSLPKEISNLTFANLINLTLHDNPWTCDCNTRWMKHWIRNMSDVKLPLKKKKIKCGDGLGKGKPILDVPDEDFVCNPMKLATILTIALTTVCLVTSLSLSLYCFRKPLRILLLSRFNFSFLRKYMNARLTHDVFVSYSSHDERWVSNVLVPALEKNDPPYKVCIHYKDFEVGECIANNILNCVDSSLSTLLVLSNNFLKSEWCRFEFQSAHHRFLREKKSYMIMVLLEDLDSQNMDNEMKHYLKTKTYLKISDRILWQKLFYALPLRRIGDEEDREGGGVGEESNENRPLLETQRRRIHSC